MSDNELHAWCTATGHINLTRDIPEGVFPIARGPEMEVKGLIRSRAVHVYPRHNAYAVPGMEGAQSIEEKRQALDDFRRLLSERVAFAKAQGYDVQVTVTVTNF